ncbi:MAG: hypothetical protein JWM58_2631 [Rhizobium sp.]|nr:hypothetical protein [Rhizobium sp.]
MGLAMTDTKKNEEDKGDDILKRMLNMPPDPKTPPKPKPGKDKSQPVSK